MRQRSALRRAGGNHTGKSRYNEHTGQDYIAGDHWVECQRCGLDVRESNTRREWSGGIVCGGCFDYRQPQDFVRGRVDDTSAKGLVRPESTDTFGTHEDTPVCSPIAIAGIACAGFAIAGNQFETPIGNIGSVNLPADSDSLYSTFNIADPIGE